MCEDRKGSHSRLPRAAPADEERQNYCLRSINMLSHRWNNLMLKPFRPSPAKRRQFAAPAFLISRMIASALAARLSAVAPMVSRAALRAWASFGPPDNTSELALLTSINRGR